MNSKELIKRLNPLIADTVKWDRLEDYLNYLKDNATATLVTSTDIRNINKLQSEVLLLQRLIELPTLVRKAATL